MKLYQLLAELQHMQTKKGISLDTDVLVSMQENWAVKVNSVSLQTLGITGAFHDSDGQDAIILHAIND
jgi:hypothetical protein